MFVSDASRWELRPNGWRNLLRLGTLLTKKKIYGHRDNEVDLPRAGGKNKAARNQESAGDAPLPANGE
jgi:hypothetical protein